MTLEESRNRLIELVQEHDSSRVEEWRHVLTTEENSDRGHLWNRFTRHSETELQAYNVHEGQGDLKPMDTIDPQRGRSYFTAPEAVIDEFCILLEGYLNRLGKAEVEIKDWRQR